MFRGHSVKVTLQKAEPGTHEDISASQKRLAGLEHHGLQGARLNLGRPHFLGGSKMPVTPAAFGILRVRACV